MTIFKRMSGRAQSFPRTFWVANTMEIFERMAWYGFFAVSSLYITGKVSEGGLGFTSEQRGTLQGVITFILYLLPALTGALADRYGFRRMLIVAYAVLTPSYFLLGQFHSFWGFFCIFLLVALGAAVFKPVVIGTVARTTDESSGSIGFGIFYMMVNIGGFVGPIVAGVVRGWSWSWVFLMSSFWILLNFLLVLFYRDPAAAGEPKAKRTLGKVMDDLVEVIGNGRLFLFVVVLIVLTILGTNGWVLPGRAAVAALIWALINIACDLYLKRVPSRGRTWLDRPMRLGNWRFVLFLVILSGFWAVFNQIFMTLPEYIRDFTDTTPILRFLAALFGVLGFGGWQAHLAALVQAKAQINPEYLVNIDAGAIILLQLLISWIVARFKTFFTLVVGTFVAALSMFLFIVGASGWVVVFAIIIFAIGEMMASPKSMDYIGRIAPPEKTGMYMGYYFVAVALGNLFGGLLSGQLYGKLARDLGRPDLMWAFFGLLGVATAAALFLYDRWVVPAARDKF